MITGNLKLHMCLLCWEPTLLVILSSSAKLLTIASYLVDFVLNLVYNFCEVNDQLCLFLCS